MASEVKSKGSIIYKLLIVILAIALVATILYPKKLWKTEDQSQDWCRDNLEHILYAEYVYLSNFNSFTDTLSNAINLIKNDSTKSMLRQFINSDSLLSTEIIERLAELKYGVRVDSVSEDSARLISPEGLMVLDATVPNLEDSTAAISELVISFDGFLDRLDDHTRFNGIDTVEAFILDSLRTFPVVKSKIDSMGLFTLEHLGMCPTVGKEYKIQVVDTSAIKVVNIYCPIGVADSALVSSNLKLSKIGGLKITNHGAIENGEKSWANQ